MVLESPQLRGSSSVVTMAYPVDHASALLAIAAGSASDTWVTPVGNTTASFDLGTVGTGEYWVAFITDGSTASGTIFSSQASINPSPRAFLRSPSWAWWVGSRPTSPQGGVVTRERVLRCSLPLNQKVTRWFIPPAAFFLCAKLEIVSCCGLNGYELSCKFIRISTDLSYCKFISYVRECVRILSVDFSNNKHKSNENYKNCERSIIERDAVVH